MLVAAQIWPFPAEWTWPRELAGRPMDTYNRWMEVVIYATLAGLPAMSVPVGLNDGGLPMGMQLIGPPLGDLAVLNAAAIYKQSIGDPNEMQPHRCRRGNRAAVIHCTGGWLRCSGRSRWLPSGGFTLAGT